MHTNFGAYTHKLFMHLFEVLHHHFKLKLTMQVGKPSNLDYTLAGNVNICWLAHALKHSFI